MTFDFENEPLPTNPESLRLLVIQQVDGLLHQLEDHWQIDPLQTPNATDTTFNSSLIIRARTPPYLEFLVRSEFLLKRFPTYLHGKGISTSIILTFKSELIPLYQQVHKPIMLIEKDKYMVPGFSELDNYFITFPRSQREYPSISVTIGGTEEYLNLTTVHAFIYHLNFIAENVKLITKDLKKVPRKLKLTDLFNREFAENKVGLPISQERQLIFSRVTRIVMDILKRYENDNQLMEVGNVMTIIGWENDKRKNGYTYKLYFPNEGSNAYKFEIDYIPFATGLHFITEIIMEDQETIMFKVMKFGWYEVGAKIVTMLEWNSADDKSILKLNLALDKYPFPKLPRPTSSLKRLTGKLGEK